MFYINKFVFKSSKEKINLKLICRIVKLENESFYLSFLCHTTQNPFVVAVLAVPVAETENVPV